MKSKQAIRQGGFLLTLELAYWLPLIFAVMYAGYELLRVLLMISTLDYSLTQAIHEERMKSPLITQAGVNREMTAMLSDLSVMPVNGNLQVEVQSLVTKAPVAVVGLTRNQSRWLLVTASYQFQAIFFNQTRLPIIDWKRSILVQMEPDDAP